MKAQIFFTTMYTYSHWRQVSVVIAYMDYIYEHARVIIIALDDIELSVNEVQSLLTYSKLFRDGKFATTGEAPMRDKEPPYMKEHQYLLTGVLKILRSDWFRRGWCLHEMKLGQAHIFLVRTESLPGAHVLRLTGTFLMCLLQLFLKTLNTNVMGDEELRIQLDLTELSESVRTFLSRNYFKTFRRVYSKRGDSDLQQQATDYNGIISDVFHSNTGGNPSITDERLRKVDAFKDKVSIVLNTIRNGLALRRGAIDEKQLVKVMDDFFIRDLMLIGLAARDPVSLCSVGQPLLLGTSAHASWISWPDLLDRGSANRRLPPFDTSSHIKVDQGPGCEFVELNLCVLADQKSCRRPTDSTTMVGVLIKQPFNFWKLLY